MIGQLKSLLHRAAHLRQSGEAAEAERLFKEAAAQAEADQAMERAEALTGVAQARRDAGDRIGAAIYYAEAVTLFRSVNAVGALAHTLQHSAELRSELKEYGTAESQIQEAVRLYRSFDPASPLDLAQALRVAALNDERQAHAAWREVRDLYNANQVNDGAAEASEHLEWLKHHDASSEDLRESNS